MRSSFAAALSFGLVATKETSRAPIALIAAQKREL